MCFPTAARQRLPCQAAPYFFSKRSRTILILNSLAVVELPKAKLELRSHRARETSSRAPHCCSKTVACSCCWPRKRRQARSAHLPQRGPESPHCKTRTPPPPPKARAPKIPQAPLSTSNHSTSANSCEHDEPKELPRCPRSAASMLWNPTMLIPQVLYLTLQSLIPEVLASHLLNPEAPSLLHVVKPGL